MPAVGAFLPRRSADPAGPRAPGGAAQTRRPASSRGRLAAPPTAPRRRAWRCSAAPPPAPAPGAPARPAPRAPGPGARDRWSAARSPAAASAATPSAITSASPSGPAHARQLDAGLDELALAARGALEPHDRPLVAEAHGPLLVAKARGDEARDLRRDVGPQRHHLPRARLDEADRRRARRRAEAQRQHLLVLEGRRDDAREARALERRQQRLDRCAAAPPPPRGAKSRIPVGSLSEGARGASVEREPRDPGTT